MESEPNILMMIDSHQESGRQLIAGIVDYARLFGPWQFYWQSQGIECLEPAMEGVDFAGLLVRNVDVEIVHNLIENGVPTVTFAYGKQRMSGTGWISTDNQRISTIVADHFLKHGFSSFAFFGYEDLPWSTERGEWFARRLEKAGYSADFCWFGFLNKARNEEAVTQWLSSLSSPVAIMAANDNLGQLIIRLCRQAGLRVPEDCAVVGVDNDPVLCGMSSPPLSSVGIDQYHSGYHAAALLDQMMKGDPPENLQIMGSAEDLEVRQSSNIFAVDDLSVAKALQFIQRNAHRPLTVDEVVDASGIYRRALERRFRKYQFTTILQYCREARAEHIAKVLRVSELSLEEIAKQCGFPQASHFTRFFLSIRGETPSSYRKRIKHLG